MDPEPCALPTSLGHNTLTTAGTTPCRLFSPHPAVRAPPPIGWCERFTRRSYTGLFQNFRLSSAPAARLVGSKSGRQDLAPMDPITVRVTLLHFTRFRQVQCLMRAPVDSQRFCPVQRVDSTFAEPPVLHSCVEPFAIGKQRHQAWTSNQERQGYAAEEREGRREKTPNSNLAP